MSFVSIKRMCFFLALSGVLLIAVSTFAADEANVSGDGAAIHGYDPVAYHRLGKPVKGSNKFTAE